MGVADDVWNARRFLLRFEAHTMPPEKKMTGSTSGTTMATC